MAGRSDARKCVLQMLFLVDQNPDADLHWIRNSVEEQLNDETLVNFAWSLFTGVREQRDAIDEKITAVSDHWRIDRMAPTDRNVIRIGIFEIEKIGTPSAVVLNEAVELAREFGTEHSSAFVNGILDKLATQGQKPAGAVDTTDY